MIENGSRLYLIDGVKKNFGEIYSLYKEEIYTFCFRFFYNQSDAEDVSHEVFLSVFKYIDSYNPQKGSFRSWIFKITYNGCCKYKKKISDLFLKDSDELDRYSSDTDKKNYLEQYDLEKALGRLKKKYRIPLILTKIRGFSMKESGDILSLSENTIKQRVFRGIKKLKEYLEEE